MSMYLKPSEIFYSQDSINNVFDKRCNHSYEPIGKTLDALCEGRCSVESIPAISVMQKDGKWVTADNRRLWVFRQLERLGKCEKIFVRKGYYIPDGKLTSENGGATVRVRGSPGGRWHNMPSVIKPKNTLKNTNAPINTSYHGTNVLKKPVTPSPTVTSIRREPHVYNNQFNRATSSDYGRFENYSSNVSGSMYGHRMGVRETLPVRTTYTTTQPTITAPRVSPTVRYSPGVSNQYGRGSNVNQSGYGSYGRNTDRDFDDYITRHEDASRRGTGSDTYSNYSDKSLTGSAKSTETAGHSARYAPERRAYTHKTYDTSYRGGRQNRASSPSTTRDNGCCIII